MIPCGDWAEIGGWRGGPGVVCSPGRIYDGMRRGNGKFRSKLYKNNQQSLGFGVVTF